MVAQMRSLTEAIREKRVQLSTFRAIPVTACRRARDPVSKMHRHFPGQIVDKRHQSEFNQRCELDFITAYGVREGGTAWMASPQIKPLQFTRVPFAALE